MNKDTEKSIGKWEKIQLNRNIYQLLGFTNLGFIDYEKWAEFRKSYFYREGKINGEEYSNSLNQVLSGAAMQHTLEEIKKRFDKLIDEK